MTFGLAERAFGVMGFAPADLEKALQAAALMSGTAPVGQAEFFETIGSAPANEPIRILFAKKLIEWDHQDADWANGSPSNSDSRRLRIYELLGLDDSSREVCTRHFPFYAPPERLLVIADKYNEWYSRERQTAHNFYWTAYTKYLTTRPKDPWSPVNIAALEKSTFNIVRRLADPTQVAAYRTRGLVVGHVQSGKTANFTGVIARAADAGYRLIIVLAGTMNILRAQTQRRVDKELIGIELIRPGADDDSDVEYAGDQDWKEFISHGGRPSERGEFDWQRLTRARYDYQSLKAGIDALEFERRDPSKPFYDPINLYPAKARLIVMKKNAAVIRKVAKDLRKIRSRLEDIPAIVIDDESDQASLNTRPPAEDQKARSTINRSIVELLGQLPRAQYVGYTATPFANVFVDPDDSEDLFPKDFVVALERPPDYMGITEFHDLSEPKPSGLQSNERAFIRGVLGDEPQSDSLRTAIDSYVLTGALKIFRIECGEPIDTRHHTMLAHTSQRTAEHKVLADRVRQLVRNSGYEAGTGLDRLRELFEVDFSPVASARAPERPMPASFRDLRPALGRCLQLMEEGPDPVLIVNGLNEQDTPDFDKTRVWKIIVGGTKLSRGYTIEGLTVSYYRRPVGAADTLMQMGRWFGFRKGYGDLVRVFIGRAERFKGRELDLYEAFEAVCKDEIEFRSQLERYAFPEDGALPITPMQVPPLVPSHLKAIAPTAKNKMYNAVVKFMNFGSEAVERTLAPSDDTDRRHNEAKAVELLGEASLQRLRVSVRFETEEPAAFDAFSGTVAPARMIEFLNSYRWFGLARTTLIQRELEYLQSGRDICIDRWLVLAPQLGAGRATWRAAGKEFTIHERSRSDATQRFKVFTGSDHVSASRYLAGLLEGEANSETMALRSKRQGVMLFYPVVAPKESKRRINVGFALRFPANSIAQRIAFGVADPDSPEAPIIDLRAGHRARPS